MCESTIKKGALVKVWDEGEDFSIGVYNLYYGRHEIYLGQGCFASYENAIEIPEELAKQLEELGK